jgi:thymidylate synthase
MFSAWPANAIGLRKLQEHIRDEIATRSSYDMRLGPLITISQSAHIYDDTWENADQLIQQQYSAICRRRDYYDPAGNFLIEIEVDKIVVRQTTPGSGEVVACYSGKDPLKLVREICAASPAINPEHAGYLGMELQKAAEALHTGQQYFQDGK